MWKKERSKKKSVVCGEFLSSYTKKNYITPNNINSSFFILQVNTICFSFLLHIFAFLNNNKSIWFGLNSIVSVLIFFFVCVSSWCCFYNIFWYAWLALWLEIVVKAVSVNLQCSTGFHAVHCAHRTRYGLLCVCEMHSIQNGFLKMDFLSVHLNQFIATKNV